MNKDFTQMYKDVGKTILDRSGKTKGIITNMIDRWCGGYAVMTYGYYNIWKKQK